MYFLILPIINITATPPPSKLPNCAPGNINSNIAVVSRYNEQLLSYTAADPSKPEVTVEIEIIQLVDKIFSAL